MVDVFHGTGTTYEVGNTHLGSQGYVME
jgi:hypothetical protein